MRKAPRLLSHHAGLLSMNADELLLLAKIQSRTNRASGKRREQLEILLAWLEPRFLDYSYQRLVEETK